MPPDKNKYNGFCADENQLFGYAGPRTGNFLIKSLIFNGCRDRIGLLVIELDYAVG